MAKKKTEKKAVKKAAKKKTVKRVVKKKAAKRAPRKATPKATPDACHYIFVLMEVSKDYMEEQLNQDLKLLIYGGNKAAANRLVKNTTDIASCMPGRTGIRQLGNHVRNKAPQPINCDVVLQGLNALS